MAYVTLEGYEVMRITEKAIGIAKCGQFHDDLDWIPKSQCENGQDLEKGDTDICVAEWKADELGLDY